MGLPRQLLALAARQRSSSPGMLVTPVMAMMGMWAVGDRCAAGGWLLVRSARHLNVHHDEVWPGFLGSEWLPGGAGQYHLVAIKSR